VWVSVRVLYPLVFCLVVYIRFLLYSDGEIGVTLLYNHWIKIVVRLSLWSIYRQWFSVHLGEVWTYNSNEPRSRFKYILSSCLWLQAIISFRTYMSSRIMFHRTFRSYNPWTRDLQIEYKNWGSSHFSTSIHTTNKLEFGVSKALTLQRYIWYVSTTDPTTDISDWHVQQSSTWTWDDFWRFFPDW
jgi:hypothetical protein